MKVYYIYREKERKAHSIENLFDAISHEVEKEGVKVERWYKPLSNIKAIFAIRKLKADIYHITGDCYFLSLFLPWRKTIMTVHDIGMYKNHSKTLKKRLFALLSFILPFKLLKVSTAISELTKNDLVNILKVNKGKIKVIPNPLVLPIKYNPREFNIKKPNILQIGTGEHKNLIGLIEGIKDVACHLEIIGKPSNYLIGMMQDYNISYRISSGLSMEEVVQKYIECDILYFASLSEGFGLPILEAQATGRPVITSNTEPTASVSGGSALLVNPNDYISIRNAVLKICEDGDLRTELIDKGLSNIEKYNLKSISDQYLSLYKSIVNHD